MLERLKGGSVERQKPRPNICRSRILPCPRTSCGGLEHIEVLYSSRGNCLIRVRTAGLVWYRRPSGALHLPSGLRADQIKFAPGSDNSCSGTANHVLVRHFCYDGKGWWSFILECGLGFRCRCEIAWLGYRQWLKSQWCSHITCCNLIRSSPLSLATNLLSSTSLI